MVQAELKATVQERKAVESRVSDLEAYVGGLKDQQVQVERLREVWGNWSGALSAEPGEVVKARSVLKKVLATPIHVWPLPGEHRRDREWAFAGLAYFDGVLAGSITRDGSEVVHRPIGTPEQLLVWYAQASGFIPPPIAGGSDAPECTHGRATSGPPTQK